MVFLNLAEVVCASSELGVLCRLLLLMSGFSPLEFVDCVAVISFSNCLPVSDPEEEGYVVFVAVPRRKMICIYRITSLGSDLMVPVCGT